MRNIMSHFFTRTSHARLLEELTKLRTQDLPTLSRAKQAAAAEGDLSENAEYHATREKLEMLQRRIYELEEQLRAPRFIEELPISCQRVSIGTRVICLDLTTRKEVVYTILGPADAIPEDNIISYQSPLARGLINKELDDDVAIAIPSGTRRLRILDIQRFDDV
jgi:transcription elongation factor GreA